MIWNVFGKNLKYICMYVWASTLMRCFIRTRIKNNRCWLELDRRWGCLVSCVMLPSVFTIVPNEEVIQNWSRARYSCFQCFVCFLQLTHYSYFWATGFYLIVSVSSNGSYHKQRSQNNPENLNNLQCSNQMFRKPPDCLCKDNNWGIISSLISFGTGLFLSDHSTGCLWSSLSCCGLWFHSPHRQHDAGPRLSSAVAQLWQTG